jgi:hypothetical protein
MKHGFRVAVLAALLAAGAAQAQDTKAEEVAPGDRAGPMTEIKAEESDLKLDLPQFAGARATFYRRQLYGERALRDMAVYRGKSEIAYVHFDTADVDVAGSFIASAPRAGYNSVKSLLPQNAKVTWGETRDYVTPAREYPTEHFRMEFQGGAANCITFMRVYDPKPGRSLASKRLLGVYCSTAGALDEAHVLAFFNGIRTRL